MGELLHVLILPAALGGAFWLGHRALLWLERRGVVYYLGDRR